MNEELPLVENEAQLTQDMKDELSYGIDPESINKEEK